MDTASNCKQLPHFIQLYAAWTSDIMIPSQLPGITPFIADAVVFSLGLGGETGEVVDELFQFQQNPIGYQMDNVRKEHGDAMFYWVSLALLLGFEVLSLYEAEPLASIDELKLTEISDQLVIAAGLVQEACKKYVRDANLDRAKFHRGLVLFAKSWRELCLLLKFNPAHILAKNKRKAEGRQARGTLRGSGNNR